jgi:hypothetical protein
MAKSDQKKEPELHPDAWARFERFIRGCEGGAAA